MNGTLEKFGYPATVVKEYDHWAVLLRPQQVSLGSLVLASKSNAIALGELPALAFRELGDVITELERHLHRTFEYDKINYLALMMVDPHVHFHVLPRYATSRNFDGLELVDATWPGPPDLKVSLTLPEAVRANLLWTLQQRFSGEQ